MYLIKNSNNKFLDRCFLTSSGYNYWTDDVNDAYSTTNQHEAEKWAKNFNAEPIEYLPVDADYTPITHKWVVQQVEHGVPTYYMFTVKMHKFYGKRMVMTSDIRSAHHFDTAEEAAEVYGYLTSYSDMPVHVVIVDE